jgi:hypothetical protein
MEQMEREAEDRRRCKIFQEELEYFKEHLQGKLAAREAARIRQLQEKKEFEDAALLMEESEQRKNDADEREKKRQQEEREKKRQEQMIAE